MAADPLAPLDDAPVPRSLACQRQPLPHAAPGRRRRQPRPAHLRGHQPLHRSHVDAHRRIAQRHRHAALLHRHPVDAFRGCSAAIVRHELRHSRLPGLGSFALCDGWNRADPPGRLAAGRPQLPAAAIRSGLPLQPRSGAGEFRADRPPARRERRARATAQSFRTGGRQLHADHAAHQEAHLSHGELYAGSDDLSLHRHQSRVFCRHDPARRPDADGVRLHQRANRAVVFRRCLSTARRVARGDCAARRLQCRGRERAGRGDCEAGDRGRVAHRQGRHPDRRPCGAPAARRRAGRRRRPRHCGGRTRAGHRLIRRGKIDLVPGDRRHLAVRRRHASMSPKAPRS